MTVTLSLTSDLLHALDTALERTKRSSTTVKVDRQALAAILIDHGRMVRALGQAVGEPGSDLI